MPPQLDYAKKEARYEAFCPSFLILVGSWRIPAPCCHNGDVLVPSIYAATEVTVQTAVAARGLATTREISPCDSAEKVICAIFWESEGIF